MPIFSNDPRRKKELIEQIIAALTAAQRWYVLVPDKRTCDEGHAVTLLDQLEKLQQKK